MTEKDRRYLHVCVCVTIVISTFILDIDLSLLPNQYTRPTAVSQSVNRFFLLLLPAAVGVALLPVLVTYLACCVVLGK